jgi:GntR family transcriptional regulator, transcriptional repressor for pyruvate dehydrogenase complex
MESIKKQPITEQAVQVLSGYILDGNHKNGDYLPPEIELCRRLGIGRSSLREAVKILESHGMVRKKHGVGVMIVDESDKAMKVMLKLVLQRSGTTMEELIEVRYTNEIKTTELAAINANEEEILEIKKHLEVMRNNLTSTEDYVKADIDFHMSIAKASHNRVFYLILQTIRPLIEEMIQETLKYNHRPESSMKYHEKVFKAIKSRNPQHAVMAMEEHLLGTRKMLNKVL